MSNFASEKRIEGFYCLFEINCGDGRLNTKRVKLRVIYHVLGSGDANGSRNDKKLLQEFP